MRPSSFPVGTSFTPVPNPLLGAILESIDNLAELKCILRALWHLHRKKGPLRYVTLQDLALDPVLRRELAAEDVQQAMAEATRRGVFARGVVASKGTSTTLYVLNAEADRRALESARARGVTLPEGMIEDTAPTEASGQGPNIYALYEANIGMITPLVADKLKDAEREYPWEWIEEAFKIAAELNKRSWRYVAAILERWSTEGKQDGEFRRHTEATDRKQHLKEYIQRRGKLPWA